MINEYTHIVFSMTILTSGVWAVLFFHGFKHAALVYHLLVVINNIAIILIITLEPAFAVNCLSSIMLWVVSSVLWSSC